MEDMKHKRALIENSSLRKSLRIGSRYGEFLQKKSICFFPGDQEKDGCPFRLSKQFLNTISFRKCSFQSTTNIAEPHHRWNMRVCRREHDFASHHRMWCVRFSNLTENDDLRAFLQLWKKFSTKGVGQKQRYILFLRPKPFPSSRNFVRKPYLLRVFSS